MITFLRDRGLEGATVLEVGGGVGAMELEALRAGAERAVNAELSPFYESAALALWREYGVAERTEYRVANIAADGSEIEAADAVVMHRVVCCYPDPDALVGAAAARARRLLVMSFPRERALIRVGVGAVNLVARLLRWEYRSYVHSPQEILAAAERRGLRPVFGHEGRIWQIAGLERHAA